MKFSPKTLLAAVTLPFVMTACASNGGDVKQITVKDLQHHNWELVSIDGKEVKAEGHQKRPRLELGENMMANGNAGCNNFFGQAELKDNQFRIEKMGMTMKMCMGDAMDLEQSFSKTLAEWSDMSLTNEGMVLKNDLHTLTFKLSDWKN
ncbi:heat shock protein HslJ [Vibrio coralliilyticus]|jgi:heat shock protein HslJ|uniref:Heat shock protein HslJ n=1 Tax=Vibrio coralliilyticus TaxID=190893 RepID=A0A2A2MRE9_9VIBR|nr:MULTISPECIES: META domain-containing protein [Vibrio]AIU66445.1 heat shock protein HslJ [Vibrio coralliilyticus]EEX31512.1 heat shock protein HslJ [Vibrio coralliilyticus ATCC BAA-450]KJY74334.1 heat shock protein HslJ [Vibrio coralliilyticus]MCC2523663.1 META domain-containing protein [Vibrio coralliilyticus]MCM5506822.1 META domain-containing protein [Vibrio sp. SCSIO 43169]